MAYNQEHTNSTINEKKNKKQKRQKQSKNDKIRETGAQSVCLDGLEGFA